MTQPATCPGCGAKLPANSPEGLCRACLFKRGLETNTVGYTQPPENARWTPPSVEELAARFPELEIQRLIGRGGMGAVYQARQKSLDRTVALKILPPAMASEAAFAERFAREAQAMAKLNHPHIVTLYEFGHLGARASSPALPTEPTSPDLYYFLMEYVDGVSLRGLLDTGHVSPREALAIVPQICEALQYAHDHGIVHRDIKPENILLNKQGQVKIADFGLAKLMGVAGERRKQRTESRNVEAEVTAAGSVMGTPAYMAPEQTDRPSEVDHRADIYSLGVVFYQMLTGELPKGAFEPPSRKVQIDVRLDEIVLKAMEKEPERRYSQASEIKTKLETITTEPRTAARLSYATRYASEDEPRLSRAAIIGAFWSVFAILAAMFLWVALTEGGPGQSPTKLGYFFVLTVVPLGVSALLGTTILGWIAVSQIRHSAGRLYGLGLAVFDGLLFPLLLLDLVIATIAIFALRLFRLDLALVLLLLLPVIAAIDLLIVRRVWRAVNAPFPGSAHSIANAMSDRPAQAANTSRVPLLATILTLATLGVIALVWRPMFAAPHVWSDEQTRQFGVRPDQMPLGLRPEHLTQNRPQIPPATISPAVVEAYEEVLRDYAGMPPISFSPVISRTINDLDEKQGNEAIELSTGRMLSIPSDAQSSRQIEEWFKSSNADLLADFARNRWALMGTSNWRLSECPARLWDVASLEEMQAVLNSSTALQRLERSGKVFFILPEHPSPPMTFVFEIEKPAVESDNRDLLLQRAEAISHAKALQKEADALAREGKPAEAAITLEQHKALRAQIDLLSSRIERSASPPATTLLGVLQITGFHDNPRSISIRYKLVPTITPASGRGS